MNTQSQMIDIYAASGKTKTTMPLTKLFVLAIFAGAYIALGALGSSIASCGVKPAAVSRLLSAVIFPVGLVMVVVGGSELFTGNSLIIISALEKKSAVSGMIKNWVVVWVGNFVGSMFVASICVYSNVMNMYGGELAKTAVNVATTKVNLTFAEGFLRAILCNVMVCVAVWMTLSPKQISGKILSAFLPIVVFVLAGFEHCVANFYFIPVGLMSASHFGIAADSSLTWINFLVKNEIPVTLGNIAGGCLVGAGYWLVYSTKADK